MQTYLRRDIRPSGKLDFRWSTSACFPVFIQSGIYFPPPAKGWRSPFLSRTGNVSHAFLFLAFVCLLFNKVEEVQHSIVIPSDSHSGINYPPTFVGPPFSPERSCIRHASHLQDFCILTFHKRIFRFTPAIPTGFHSSEPKAHFPYTLSIEALIPAGITHSVFVPRLPVMVSLFHIPLAK